MGLTAERAKEVLEYNPETGAFLWKEKIASKVVVGTPAGCVRSGRRSITVEGERHLASRLAFLIVYGRWPEGFVDHKDRNTLNDRISNLRDATRTQNLANSKRRKDNATGFKGVWFSNQKKKYQSIVERGGKRHHCGFHLRPEDAHAAYVAKAKELFGEFYNSGAV